MLRMNFVACLRFETHAAHRSRSARSIQSRGCVRIEVDIPVQRDISHATPNGFPPKGTLAEVISDAHDAQKNR